MCHVLVIEDDWLIAEHVAGIARDAGATTVDMADTQQSAIDAAYSHTPGIILSDVNLLEGTGPRAVQAILEGLGPIPVIFITGTPEECIPCDPPAVIMGKPVNSGSLTDTFKQLAPLNMA